MAENGVFIVLEGPEGSGKSTQAKILHDNLREIGLASVLTKEPGGTPEGIKIREHVLRGDLLPEAELDLFIRDREIHVREFIKPRLEQGAWVITDRFSLSTVAYQHYGRGLPLGLIVQKDAEARAGLEPDIVIVLDVPPQEGLFRVARRKERITTFEAESRSFHKRVRRGFRDSTHYNNSIGSMYLINANRPIEKVAQAIWRVMVRRFPHLG